MPNFNLSTYATVAERLTQFWTQFPNGRIVTEIVSLDGGTVTIKASVWRDNANVQSDNLPDSTGHAVEKLTGNKREDEFWVERGETSAVGRALALAGYSLEKGVASAQEMAKVQRVENEVKAQSDPRPTPGFTSSPDDLPTTAEAQALKNSGGVEAAPGAASAASAEFGVFGTEASLNAAVAATRKAVEDGKWTKQQISDEIERLGGTPDGRSPKKSLVTLPDDDAALAFLGWVSGDFTVEKPNA